MFGAARSALQLSRLRICSTLLPIAAAQRPRNVSTVSFEPTIRQFLVKLSEHQPCFAMNSSSVSIMHEPRIFYQTLLSMIRKARHRLFLSSLYIGHEDVELIDAIHTSLRESPSLHVYIHLDLNRSTRPGPDSTANILLPLLIQHPDRVHVYLFRSPKLKGIMARIVPPRFNEGWGTWHPKIYGADDTLIISGANLNTSYFSNRQDRYLQFTDQARLADYCFSFLQAASTFSYSLLPSPGTTNNYVLHWSDVHTHPHHIEAKARQALICLQNVHRGASGISLVKQPDLGPSAHPDAEDDVLVFPMIQAGLFGIREEELCLSLLFRELSAQQRYSIPPTSGYEGPLVDLTSGYFALYKPYQSAVIDSRLACRILAASPRANGFYKSRGVSGRIHEAYTLFERRFMDAVRSVGAEWSSNSSDVAAGVRLQEWQREGWTYHAKGIWVRPTPTSTPALTLFGSTNLNSRSANLDTELSFVLATRSPALRQRFAEEVEGLREHARPWRGQDDSDEARRVRLGTRALVAFVGGML
ncbi:CDP-diacylglycerol-glycerol-3-phosphate 3-phosphatidyltransferase [Dichomitus squalens]|uniref:CDP-diacylglycerol--glycerol-3-phosphate 3-phosphatidyltransferase n=1 Tax=Dichomitus squalens TaxID=114155 RepID=A0A4V2K9V9_9APHY|nr:CDP-diacylglycerol-glycerol-3-phosphate 3-phosphatidyltransferase [Dichomitus squalens]TBU65438.1 CDP-diacylglycerol-glycerol-3-phosphate 3-phosphatidyltransferase [Dichomitus squalens]